jgi:hypothetical protein
VTAPETHVINWCVQVKRSRRFTSAVSLIRVLGGSSTCSYYQIIVLRFAWQDKPDLPLKRLGFEPLGCYLAKWSSKVRRPVGDAAVQQLQRRCCHG